MVVTVIVDISLFSQDLYFKQFLLDHLTHHVRYCHHTVTVFLVHFFPFQSSRMKLIGPLVYHSSVGMFIGWPSTKFMSFFFLSEIHSRNKRSKGAKNDDSCFLHVDYLFFNKFWWLFFFMIPNEIFCLFHTEITFTVMVSRKHSLGDILCLLRFLLLWLPNEVCETYCFCSVSYYYYYYYGSQT